MLHHHELVVAVGRAAVVVEMVALAQIVLVGLELHLKVITVVREVILAMETLTEAVVVVLEVQGHQVQQEAEEGQEHQIQFLDRL